VENNLRNWKIVEKNDFVREEHKVNSFEKNKFYLMYDKNGQITFGDSPACGVFGDPENNELFAVAIQYNFQKVCKDMSKEKVVTPEKCLLFEDAIRSAKVYGVREIEQSNIFLYENEEKAQEIYFSFANSPVYVLIKSSQAPFGIFLNLEQEKFENYVKYECLNYPADVEIKDLPITKEHKDIIAESLKLNLETSKDKIKHVAMKHLIKEEFSSYSKKGIDFASKDKMDDGLVDIMRA